MLRWWKVPTDPSFAHIRPSSPIPWVHVFFHLRLQWSQEYFQNYLLLPQRLCYHRLSCVTSQLFKEKLWGLHVHKLRPPAYTEQGGKGSEQKETQDIRDGFVITTYFQHQSIFEESPRKCTVRGFQSYNLVGITDPLLSSYDGCLEKGNNTPTPRGLGRR